MPSNSWREFLVFISPAVVALLLATAKWVESRARITSEVGRSISQEAEQTSREARESPENSASERDAPAPKKSSTRGTTSTSPGEHERHHLVELERQVLDAIERRPPPAPPPAAD